MARRARLFKRVNRPLERGLPPAREKMLDLPVRTRRRLTGQYRERFPRFIFTVNYKIFLQFMRHPVGDLPWHIYTVTRYKWRHVWNIFNAALFMTWFHPFYTRPSHFLPWRYFSFIRRARALSWSSTGKIKLDRNGIKRRMKWYGNGGRGERRGWKRGGRFRHEELRPLAIGTLFFNWSIINRTNVLSSAWNRTRSISYKL